jgi:hypothetical protein
VPEARAVFISGDKSVFAFPSIKEARAHAAAEDNL